MVVGAFPEPFLHGWDGKVRPVAVRYAPGLRRGARSIGRLLRASSVQPLSVAAPPDANVFFTVSGSERFVASLRDDSSGDAGSPVEFTFAGDAVDARTKPGQVPLPLPGAMSPVPAAALLASLAALALAAERTWVVAAIAVGLLVAACRLRGRGASSTWRGRSSPRSRVFVLSPFVSSEGSHVIWEGPQVPVLGVLDVTSEELATAGTQALRLAAVGLAFAAYVLLLDLDRLLHAAGFARRSVLAVGPRHASRTHPRARRSRVRGGAARPRGGGERHPRPGAPALAARRRLARALAQPGGGDGGAWLRPAGPNACALTLLVVARPADDGDGRS